MNNENYSKRNLVVLKFLAALIVVSPAYAEPIDLEVMEKNYGHDYAQGYMFEQQGKYEEAEKAFARSISANPDQIQAYIERADALLQLKRYGEALNDIDRYSKLLQQSGDKNDKSRLAMISRFRAKSYDGLGKTDAALSNFKQSLAYQDNIDGHFALGSFYKKHAKNDLAVAELQTAKEKMHAGGWHNSSWAKTESEIDKMLSEINSKSKEKR